MKYKIKNVNHIALVIVALTGLWLLSGVVFPGGKKGADEKMAAGDILSRVRVRESIAEELVQNVMVTGRTQASRRVDLSAQIEGQMAELFLEKGAHVTQGQVIARLDEWDRRARVTEARQRVKQREIEYGAAKSLQSKGFNSKIKLAQTRADLESARATLVQAETALDHIEIKAPFDGMLNDQYVESGDYVTAGQRLYTLVALDPIELAGFLSERQYRGVKSGSAAQVSFLNGNQAIGKVSYLATAADEETRTFAIEISIPNPDYEVVSGFTAEISIPAATYKAHKISPSILSLNDAGQVGVKIVDADNTVRFVKVKILSHAPEFMAVEGLPDKARLIIVGQDFVADGQVVEPVAADTEKAQ